MIIMKLCILWFRPEVMHEGNVAINMVVQIPALSGDSDEYLIDLQMGDRRNPVHTQKNV